jgi:hypothetical protein
MFNGDSHPNLAYAPEEKLEVYAAATRGLLELEPDPEKQLKYADFIDIYSALDDQELERYRQLYPQEAEHMSGFAARYIDQGERLGYQRGEASLLLRLLSTKFGDDAAAAYRKQVEAADPAQLEQWSQRLLTAEHAGQVFIARQCDPQLP